MNNQITTTSGIGVLHLLGLIFVTLRLLEYIDWSWWYVTLPFWALPVLIFTAGLAVWSWGRVKYEWKKVQRERNRQSES